MMMQVRAIDCAHNLRCKVRKKQVDRLQRHHLAKNRETAASRGSLGAGVFHSDSVALTH
jgi:hypothetical protein